MRTVNASHELDSMFDLEPGKTEVFLPGKEAPTVVEGQLVPEESPQTAEDMYDRKDIEIEADISDVYSRALEAHESQMIAAQQVTDKKYSSRNAEVGAEFLKIALDALKEKNSIKDRKDKISLKTKAPGAISNTTNNIVTDRATLLKLMREQE